MLHDINHRNELERLNDRHKRLSLEVYDHLTANEEKEMVEKHKQMEETENELKLLKEKLFKKQ